MIKYVNIIERCPSALNMKVGNFGRLDSRIKSVANGSKLEDYLFTNTKLDTQVVHDMIMEQFTNKMGSFISN